jgi:hypothetical protein
MAVCRTHIARYESRQLTIGMSCPCFDCQTERSFINGRDQCRSDENSNCHRSEEKLLVSKRIPADPTYLVLADGLKDDQGPESDCHTNASAKIWPGRSVLLGPIDYLLEFVTQAPTFLTEPNESFDKQGRHHLGSVAGHLEKT